MNVNTINFTVNINNTTDTKTRIISQMMKKNSNNQLRTSGISSSTTSIKKINLSNNLKNECPSPKNSNLKGNFNYTDNNERNNSTIYKNYKNCIKNPQKIIRNSNNHSNILINQDLKDEFFKENLNIHYNHYNHTDKPYNLNVNHSNQKDIPLEYISDGNFNKKTRQNQNKTSFLNISSSQTQTPTANPYLPYYPYFPYQSFSNNNLNTYECSFESSQKGEKRLSSISQNKDNPNLKTINAFVYDDKEENEKEKGSKIRNVKKINVNTQYVSICLNNSYSKENKGDTKKDKENHMKKEEKNHDFPFSKYSKYSNININQALNNNSNHTKLKILSTPTSKRQSIKSLSYKTKTTYESETCEEDRRITKLYSLSNSSISSLLSMLDVNEIRKIIYINKKLYKTIVKTIISNANHLKSLFKSTYSPYFQVKKGCVEVRFTQKKDFSVDFVIYFTIISKDLLDSSVAIGFTSKFECDAECYKNNFRFDVYSKGPIMYWVFREYTNVSLLYINPI